MTLPLHTDQLQKSEAMSMLPDHIRLNLFYWIKLIHQIFQKLPAFIHSSSVTTLSWLVLHWLGSLRRQRDIASYTHTPLAHVLTPRGNLELLIHLLACLWTVRINTVHGENMLNSTHIVTQVQDQLQDPLAMKQHLYPLSHHATLTNFIFNSNLLKLCFITIQISAGLLPFDPNSYKLDYLSCLQSNLRSLIFTMALGIPTPWPRIKSPTKQNR